MQTKKSSSRAIVNLLIGWGIIIFSYIFIRVVFAMFGFTAVSILGIALATIPYLFAMLYYITISSYKSWYYFLGIIFPSVIEKIILYFSGAFLYDISPMNFSYVLETIQSQKQYINLFPQPAARYIIEISFMGWTYILGGIFFSVCLVLILNFLHKRTNKE